MRLREFENTLRQRLNGGATLDTALGDLRDSGASIVECIASVHAVRKCELSEAKRLVQMSAAWADVMAQNEEFHDALERGMADDV